MSLYSSSENIPEGKVRQTIEIDLIADDCVVHKIIQTGGNDVVQQEIASLGTGCGKWPAIRHVLYQLLDTDSAELIGCDEAIIFVRPQLSITISKLSS